MVRHSSFVIRRCRRVPRTEWQADAVAGEVTVRLVVVLDCPPDVAHARIARDVAGDRSGRGDDAPEAVASRLERFVEHAAPLADYYAARGAAVVRLDVGHTVTGEELRRRLEGSAPGWPEGGPGQ